ncbi:hypothetical protein EVAR_99453_1 [Eumeta japonica]|uniref:Uncharacterized protein n=1 Tax=Eumeta variegata TaxID=151549 RepID=A0A4C2ADA3_EUMVA|nr:hypothetical protein EVAR_99453_1 [Eumeta japonica]
MYDYNTNLSTTTSVAPWIRGVASAEAAAAQPCKQRDMASLSDYGLIKRNITMKWRAISLFRMRGCRPPGPVPGSAGASRPKLVCELQPWRNRFPYILRQSAEEIDDDNDWNVPAHDLMAAISRPARLTWLLRRLTTLQRKLIN